MHRKWDVKEKFSYFIGRFKNLYAQIYYHVPNRNNKKIFISFSLKDIRDKIVLTKYTSFSHIYVALQHYQLKASQLEISTSMTPINSDKIDIVVNQFFFPSLTNSSKLIQLIQFLIKWLLHPKVWLVFPMYIILIIITLLYLNLYLMWWLNWFIIVFFDLFILVHEDPDHLHVIFSLSEYVFECW